MNNFDNKSNNLPVVKTEIIGASFKKKSLQPMMKVRNNNKQKSDHKFLIKKNSKKKKNNTGTFDKPKKQPHVIGSTLSARFTKIANKAKKESKNYLKKEAKKQTKKYIQGAKNQIRQKTDMIPGGKPTVDLLFKTIDKKGKQFTNNRNRRKQGMMSQKSSIQAQADKTSIFCINTYKQAINIPNLKIPLCLGNRAANSSWKDFWTDSLQFSTGTNGVGFVAISPSPFAGVTCYYYTVTTFAGTTITIDPTLVTGINTAGNNSLIPTATYTSNPTNKCRIAGLSITITNQSQVLNQSGKIFMFDTPAHEFVDDFTESYANTIAGAKMCSVSECGTMNLFVMPVKTRHNLTGYAEEEFNTQNSGTIFYPYYPWSESFTAFSGHGDPCIWVAVFGSTATVTFDVAVTYYVEYAGPSFYAHQSPNIANDNDYNDLCAFYQQYRQNASVLARK
jgi:hypothetical protein